LLTTATGKDYLAIIDYYGESARAGRFGTVLGIVEVGDGMFFLSSIELTTCYLCC